MEEENYNNNEEVKTAEVQGNFFGKVLNWIKAKWYIVAAAVVAIIVAIVAITSIAGAKTKAVKNYIKAYNKRNVAKLMKTVDYKGRMAWSKLYIYNVKDFEDEDYDDFIEYYEDIDDEDVEDTKEDIADSLSDEFDNIKDEYKSYKISIKEIKKVEKLGKDLNAIKVKLHLEAKDKDGDKDSDTTTVTFVTYKNKLVYMGGF